MSNSNNSLLLHTYLKFYCIVLFTIVSIFSLNAQQKELDSGKKFTINSIVVTGAQSYNEKTVIDFTCLKKGDRVYITVEKLSSVTKKICEQNLFINIAFYEKKI